MPWQANYLLVLVSHQLEREALHDLLHEEYVSPVMNKMLHVCEGQKNK
jgi:hypothetical protein